MKLNIVRLLTLLLVSHAACAEFSFKLPFGQATPKAETAPKAKTQPPADPYAAVSYNKLTGQLTSLLPGSVTETVEHIRLAATRAHLRLTSRKTDGITAAIQGKLADDRVFTIDLTGKNFHDTLIDLRVAPKGLVDPKIVGGDEDAALMILQFIRREAGLKADGRRKRFFWF